VCGIHVSNSVFYFYSTALEFRAKNLKNDQKLTEPELHTSFVFQQLKRA